MIFKDTWEKTQEHSPLSETTLHAILAEAFPEERVQSYSFIPGGCANLNIRIQLLSQKAPLLLRIYLRDIEAAYREKKISELILPKIPVPQFHSIGEYDSYRYAVVKYVPGIPLRELLLRHPEFAPEQALVECGHLLAKLQQFSFPHSGFFDGDLNVRTPLTKDGFLDFVEECLLKPCVQTWLGRECIARIKSAVQEHQASTPDPTQHTLVHGDFDPANILVQQCHGAWKVSAILDWEFAFAGPWLTDVSNMLRYSHRAAPYFESSFLTGLAEEGVLMPADWRITVDLSNLLSLLDCLCRNTTLRPRQNQDVISLIHDILARLR